MAPRAHGPVSSLSMTVSLPSGHNLLVAVCNGEMTVSHVAGNQVHGTVVAATMDELSELFSNAARNIRARRNHSVVDEPTFTHNRHIRVVK